MGRPNSCWFHSQSGWWVTERGGRRYRIAQGVPSDTRRKSPPLEVRAKFGAFLAECDLNPPVDTGPDRVTVASLIDSYLDLGCSANEPRTVAEKKRLLQWFCDAHGSMLVKDLTPYHLERWLADHPQWESRDTKAKVTAVIKAAFGWATKRRLIPHHPFSGFTVSGGNKRRPMTAQEFRKLWAETRRGRKTGVYASAGRRFREMLLFLKLTGARPKEARDLMWTDLDLDHDLAVLKSHKTAKKTEQPRVLILVDRVLRLLETIRERDGGTGHVFQTVRGGAWFRTSLGQKLNRARQKAGIPEDTVLYGLRHRFGTTAVLRGLDLKTVGVLMGHTEVRTTERYVHIAQRTEHLKRAMSQATRPRSS